MHYNSDKPWKFSFPSSALFLLCLIMRLGKFDKVIEKFLVVASSYEFGIWLILDYFQVHQYSVKTNINALCDANISKYEIY